MRKSEARKPRAERRPRTESRKRGRSYRFPAEIRLRRMHLSAGFAKAHRAHIARILPRHISAEQTRLVDKLVAGE